MSKRPKGSVSELSRRLLDAEELRRLASKDYVEDALALATAKGCVMYPKPSEKHLAVAMPMALLPCPVAEDCFRLAKDLAPDFHLLMDRVSCDLEWLRRALEKTACIDVISRKLLEICARVYNVETGKDPKQEIRLHLMRNDFMLDMQKGPSEGAMVQIELNMMSASFASHGQDLTEIHRYLLSKHVSREGLEALPESHAVRGMARAMAAAHAAYRKRFQLKEELPLALLFVVLEEEKNELDQRKLELACFAEGLVSLRRSLQDLATAELRPLGARKALVVDGHEVTVCYFRAGYWPEHLKDSWHTRELLELSAAVKCPSAPAQLAGMKKVQQLLCDGSELRRFLPEATAVAKTFGRQLELSAVAVAKATARPADWVLKPQVEGSGELYFDEDIPRVLSSRSSEELAEFILMERVRPPCAPSAVLQEGEVVVRPAVAELGIFGSFLAVGEEVKCNEAVGHLLRSKGQQTKQGGVFVGNAALDVPFLVPRELYWRSVG